MMNWLKKLMLLRLLILVDLLEKADFNTKIYKTEKKITTKNIAARLKQANLESKNYITGSVKQTYFDKKLKKLNKKTL